MLDDPIVAWRLWHVNNALITRLVSPTRSYIWPPMKRAEAMCGAKMVLTDPSEDPTNPVIIVSGNMCGTTCPSSNCGCGFYGWKSQSEVPANLSSSQTTFVAVGQVSLWGRVVEHEFGFRAQYAYPLGIKLIAPRSNYADEVAAKLAAAYAVEVEVS